MAKTIPFYPNPGATDARRTRMTMLLPRATADVLSLQVHVALDAMRRGSGNVRAAQTLTQAMIITGLLAENGHGSTTIEQLQRAEQAIVAAFDRGRTTGVWLLGDDAFALFAMIASTYDYQLQHAPLSAIADANDRLNRFQAGESFEKMACRRRT